MPTYPILEGVTLDGVPLEPVAAGFNKHLLTDLLRGEEGFEGLVLSDWAVTNDCNEACTGPTAEHPQQAKDIGMPWGVEALTPPQRFAKGVMAGIDQFGGSTTGPYCCRPSAKARFLPLASPRPCAASCV
jgi:beta-glucosidase